MKKPHAKNRADKAMRPAWMLVRTNHQHQRANRPLAPRNQIGAPGIGIGSRETKPARWLNHMGVRANHMRGP